MKGKNLYTMGKLCGDCGKLCSKNMNRLLEKMSILDNKKSVSLLVELSKLSIVMEYLCSYISNLCCNVEKISKFALSELKDKCKKMIDLSKKIKVELKKEKNSSNLIKYIKCDEFIKICSNIHTKCN